MRILILAILPAGSVASAHTQPSPEGAPDGNSWDLSSLFGDDKAWEAERSRVVGKLDSIRRLKGTLGRDASALSDGLDEIAELRRRAGRLELYGILRSDADTKSEVAASMAQVGPALAAQVDATVSFSETEIRALGEEQVAKWLREEPRLGAHRRRLNRILRDAPHSPSSEAQALLHEAAEWPATSAAVYCSLGVRSSMAADQGGGRKGDRRQQRDLPAAP